MCCADASEHAVAGDEPDHPGADGGAHLDDGAVERDLPLHKHVHRGAELRSFAEHRRGFVHDPEIIADGFRDARLEHAAQAQYGIRLVLDHPGATIAELVDRALHSARPVQELAEVLGDAARAPRVIVYCSSGTAAAAAALALTLTGAGSVSVYDGSLGEWSADPTAPLQLGA